MIENEFTCPMCDKHMGSEVPRERWLAHIAEFHNGEAMTLARIIAKALDDTEDLLEHSIDYIYEFLETAEAVLDAGYRLQ